MPPPNRLSSVPRGDLDARHEHPDPLPQEPPSLRGARIDALNNEDLLRMSFVTHAELLKGAQRKPSKAAVLERLDALIRLVPVAYPNSPTISEHYAVQSTALKASGTPIGANDLWIACHALAEHATLVTNNLREFERVDGLSLDNWAA